jgi:hypothetical protein
MPPARFERTAPGLGIRPGASAQVISTLIIVKNQGKPNQAIMPVYVKSAWVGHFVDTLQVQPVSRSQPPDP